MKTVNIGIAGLGTIGTGVVKLLAQTSESIRKKTGFDIVVRKACDLDPATAKGLRLKEGAFTRSLDDVLDDPEIDIVIELIGNIAVARKFILEAMKKGKHIVTANKALLAVHFEEIFSSADKFKVSLGFEASVAGGIPIIRILQEDFLTNRIRKIYGILNGTTNYILTKMSRENMTFPTALKEAQQKGFAEANPTFDIDGIDAAHKAFILASLAFRSRFSFKDVLVKGINNFDVSDIRYAAELGYVIKLLAVAKRLKNETFSVYVEPALVPRQHLLASVSNEFNAVYVDGEACGESVFYGRGAGAFPTANSVLSDIIDISKGMLAQTRNIYYADLKKPAGKINQGIVDKYYLRLQTVDKPGVLGKVAGILGKHQISISSCVQKATDRKVVPLILTTDKCRRDAIEAAVRDLQKLREIHGKVVVLNIQ
jgi:homoserine dehydrogenase